MHTCTHGCDERDTDECLGIQPLIRIPVALAAETNMTVPLSKNRNRIRIAAGWGLLLGSLTFAVGPISTISQKPILGAIQKFLMISLLPGLIGAGAVGGNMRAFPLAPGALINALLNFCSSWLVLALIGRFRGTRKIV